MAKIDSEIREVAERAAQLSKCSCRNILGLQQVQLRPRKAITLFSAVATMAANKLQFQDRCNGRYARAAQNCEGSIRRPDSRRGFHGGHPVKFSVAFVAGYSRERLRALLHETEWRRIRSPRNSVSGSAKTLWPHSSQESREKSKRKAGDVLLGIGQFTAQPKVQKEMYCDLNLTKITELLNGGARVPSSQGNSRLQIAAGMLGPSQNVPDVPAGTLWKTCEPPGQIDTDCGYYFPLLYCTKRN